jgi:hypothetical protein
MKFVYVILKGDLNQRTNRFDFYNTQVFTSKAKAIASADNSILCNGGYNIEEEEDLYYDKRKWNKTYTYSCLSYAEKDEDKQDMRIRLVLSKVEIS